MIELESVGIERNGATLLSGVSLTLEIGVTAVIGPSGSGKSTLLRVIAGLEAPSSGVVRIQGRVASCSGRVLIAPERRNVSMVFQDLALWPHMDVSENIAFGLRARRVPTKAREDAVARVLALVGLGGKATRRIDSLSGGERQRVAIARALALEPLALLLDEPLGNLDVVSKDDLLRLFRGLVAQHGIPALFVTHDPHESRLVADRLAVLEAGRIVQIGSESELRDEPATPFVRHFVE